LRIQYLPLSRTTRFIRRVPSLPVIVGVSAPRLCRHAHARASMDPGAAGVMIAPPSALRTDD
jgi:4-hydroxy-tetrahydrodipicolinate synthase